MRNLFIRITELLTASLLFFVSIHTYAATECMFNETYSVSLEYKLIDKLYFFDVIPPSNGYRQIFPQSSSFLAPLSAKITSTCNAGQDGQRFLSKAGNYTGSLERYITREDRKLLLYPTSLPGLYYSVTMYSTRCPTVSGSIPPDKSYVQLADVGDDREKTCLKNSEPYYFTLSFYIGSDYKENATPQDFSSGVTSEHGRFMLSGSTGDKDQKEVIVNDIQINGQIKHRTTTCPTSDVLLKEMQTGLSGNNLIVTAQHRGDFTNTLPENSLGAFHASYERCRANVETDVRSTSDNKLVIFHDVKIGKMLEPTYDPISNTGPNDLLSNITLDQLKQKKLVNVTTRQATSYTVPTVDEMLQDYISYNGQSLLYLETKSASVIIPTALSVYNQSVISPASNLLQRVILKVNMAAYPSPDLWKKALIDAGIPSDKVVMIDPVITPNDAPKIDALPDTTFACPSGVQNTKAVCAVRAWANAPATLAPMVSVLIKDSSDFLSTTSKTNQQGTYDSPENLNQSNTKSGTVAEMVATIKSAGKAFEIFAAIPDYMFWKDLNFYTSTVYDANVPTDISVRDAFYNNDSSCCYRVLDKLNPSPVAAEKNDYRLNLGWLRDIGANVITADDTDSINTYFSASGALDKTLTPSPKPPLFELQSLLAWQLGYATRDTELLANKGISVGGAVYALYDATDTWAWTYLEDPPIPVTKAGYSPYMTIQRVSDGRVRIIQRFHAKQCLWSDPSTSDWTWTQWKGGTNCADASSLWQMQPQGNNIYAYVDTKQRMLTWESSGKLYWGWKYGWVYTTPAPSTPSDWFYWKLK
ncbi:glycerophosphodiester phosphodiesterase family protein [Lelliottia sp. V106_10]|uniref:glycerophosphodiester phosphodiesterase family protein n=1 Tax=Lelliottia wanjuensis TaxID=3050585 RepID=UPI00254AA609|nr:MULTISPECIES: glycerophosphodiester phosphodiesterase family protein [unclassified Lelliottia]MDK9358832.1 glycerophosphodiester phosphodiesterase family protein [Lelliottia sp. V106_16]MDK9373519.1 glycerophosphodiester phosphodiesterase family protein [Lelliottia sp. V106_10]MDK9600440.1 glycerophosphodiester phosphodiesterase family protein [Lelliottia sp. V106_5]